MHTHTVVSSPTPSRTHPLSAPVIRPAGVPLRTPVHPGRFLRRHFVEPLKLTQSDTARLLGVSRRRLHEIVQGQRSMTPDTAIRCALAFGTDAAFWLALQAAWDNFYAWKSLHQQSRNPLMAQAYPLPSMRILGSRLPRRAYRRR